MKTTSPSLEAHLQQGGTQLATCWRITRTDGSVWGYTSHDQPLTIAGLTYQPTSGFSPNAIDTKEGLAVDNTELQAIVLSAEFSEAELLAGKWDFAQVQIFQVDWQNPAAGALILRAGKLGEVEFSAQGERNAASGAYRAELRGLMQQLSQQIGEVVSSMCRASLGDGRCGVNLAALTLSVVVQSASPDRRNLSIAALAPPSGYFDYGKITFSSGANNGLSMEVAEHIAGAATSLMLFEPMPYPIAVGDSFSLSPGCDRLFATCVAKFNNAINFRGEPHLPGQDKLMQPGR